MFSAIAWWGVPTVERTAMLGGTTQSMILPLWPFQFTLLACFALTALVTLFTLYQDVQALRGKTVCTWAPAEAGLDVCTDGHSPFRPPRPACDRSADRTRPTRLRAPDEPLR